jgi:RHS repeat-associated protein
VAWASQSRPNYQTGFYERHVHIGWGDLRRTRFLILDVGLYGQPGPFPQVILAGGVPAKLTYNVSDQTWEGRPFGGQDVFKFDWNFRPLSVRDAEEGSPATVFTFDGSGRLSRIASSVAPARRLDVAWGADGRIAAVTDPTGRSVSFTYDAEGYLTAVTNPIGQRTSYAYSDLAKWRGNKPLARITDHWGRVVTDVTYNPNSPQVRSYTEEGETYTYTPGDGFTLKADSSGQSWVYRYDRDGRVTEERSPFGHTKTIAYDGLGNVAGVIDEVGVWNTYLYSGNYPYYTMSRRTLDQGGPQEVRFDYTYDAALPEKPISILPKKPNGSPDPDWPGSAYEYWPAGSLAPGRVKKVFRVRQDGVIRDLLASYEYNPNGQVTRVTDASGAVTDYGYDSLGNLTAMTAPSNNDAGTRPLTLYGYDALGRVTTVTDPRGQTTTYTYDALDRVKSVTLPKPVPSSPLTFVTQYSYDNYDSASGLLFTHVTDPNGQVSKQGYDQFGRLVKALDALGNATLYGYANGFLSTVTDANGNVTSYSYDLLRRLSQTTFPDGASESYEYSPDGLLARKFNRGGQTVTYTYDRLKRLNEASYSTGGVVTYTYDGQKLTQVTDTRTSPSETHLFTYDPSFRVASITQGSRGTVSYQYHPHDLVSNLTVQGGPSATYSYYPDSSLNTIAWTPVAGTFKYRYSLAGEYQQITFPNSQRRDFTFDNQGRLTSIANIHPTSGNLATYSYAYDLNHATGAWNRLGQSVSTTATIPSQGLSGHQTKYFYDPLYQLTGVDYPAVTPFNGEQHRWTYDAIGNRLTNTVGAATQTYTYQKIGANPKNWQRLTSDGINTYTYDANGNTATRSGPGGNVLFGWDAESRLTGISGAVSAAYLYDYQGRRASKTSGTTTSFLYDGLNLIRETGASSADYLLGPGIDQPLAMSRAGQIYYYATDALGSVTALANSSGTVQDKYLYDAWGAVRSQTEAVPNPITYTGREKGEAGAGFYRARYYQPSIGRFLSEDPIRPEVPGSDSASILSLDRFTFRPPQYEYVGSDPINWIDPRGQHAMAAAAVFVGGGSAAAAGGAAVVVGGGVAFVICYASPACRQEMKCGWGWAKDAARCTSRQFLCPDDEKFRECFRRAGKNWRWCRTVNDRPYPDPWPPERPIRPPGGPSDGDVPKPMPWAA